MSNTHHHKMQKHQHIGEDFGGRYSCNKCYSNIYGKYGRKKAHKEMRCETRRLKNQIMKTQDF